MKVSTVLTALALAGGCAWSAGPPAPRAADSPALDVIWVPSDLVVVTAMLDMAKVGPQDVVYDLGCGDGRIVITAATRYGARGVGVDLDPERIGEARRNAVSARATERVTFVEQDLFATDISPATVVTLYLSPQVNLRLRPKLWRELRPGSRVVSHDFDMGDWLPERALELPLLPRVRRVYLWRIPTASVPRSRYSVPGIGRAAPARQPSAPASIGPGGVKAW